MALRKIDVDDEVFAAIEREAVPFVDTTPNDVLRRTLLSRPSQPSRKPGDLMPLIEAGRLKPGDRLVHHQPRKGRTFTAEVTSDGHVQLDDGRTFPAPSPALKARVGTEVNGWAQWIVERTGQSLKELRDS
jgi:Restriction Enzyme Adenine Methylase Associated